MRRTFSIAVVASCLVAPGIAFAQDNLPQTVIDLGLSNVEIREKPRAEFGRRVRGTLPNGALIEIDLDVDDVIEDIEARGNDLFPLVDIDILIPTPVRRNESWPADARLEEIEFEKDGRIEIEGRLADGREFDAEFAGDGRLIDFNADD